MTPISDKVSQVAVVVTYHYHGRTIKGSKKESERNRIRQSLGFAHREFEFPRGPSGPNPTLHYSFSPRLYHIFDQVLILDFKNISIIS